MVVPLKQSTPFIVQAIPHPSHANPEVTFNGQWLAENISDIIDNIVEIGLSARDIELPTTIQLMSMRFQY